MRSRILTLSLVAVAVALLIIATILALTGAPAATKSSAPRPSSDFLHGDLTVSRDLTHEHASRSRAYRDHVVAVKAAKKAARLAKEKAIRLAAARAAQAKAARAAAAVKKQAPVRRSTGGAPAVTSGSVWDRLAMCESGGRWAYNGSSGYDGGLQFSPGTWTAYKLSGYPAYAWQASREQQIAVAERVLASQGWGAWPACSSKLGLR